MKKIQNHSPDINLPEAKRLINKCLTDGWISTGSKIVDLFEKKISFFTGAKYVVAVNSGTTALQLALKLAGVKLNDEVIVPTLTFVGTINSVVHNNATPVFMDCDQYYNLDISKTIEFLEKNTSFKNGNTINKKTGKIIRAIVPVHIWGNGLNLHKLIKICKKRKIKIVEDAAESLGTFIKYKNKKKHSGLTGFLGCLSFNANKIITTGNGGAIITNNKKLAQKAFYLSTQAKKKTIEFIHNDAGYNFRMSALPAALGISQIKNIKKKLLRKKEINIFYKKNISKLQNFFLAETPSQLNDNNWLNILQFNFLKNKSIRKKLLNFFISSGVEARPVWILCHKQKPFKKFETYKINNALRLYNKSICLPSGPGLTIFDLKYIIKILKKFISKNKKLYKLL